VHTLTLEQRAKEFAARTIALKPVAFTLPTLMRFLAARAAPREHQWSVGASYFPKGAEFQHR